MRVNLEEGFNPFYDSKFRISIEGSNAPKDRMLVGLYNDELLRLKVEIDDLLCRMGIINNSIHTEEYNG